MAPPPGGAVVRMYCTGLGDCFLLGFRGRDGETSYVLIDCGVWKGTAGATDWMRKIFQHIREEVGERGLTLLVATHQHWDHLSGFGQARDLFEDSKLRVRHVWLPWTENPQDGTALRMAEERRLALRTAVAALSRLRSGFTAADRDATRPTERRTAVESLETVLKFAGYTPEEDADAAEEDAALAALELAASPDLLGAGPSTESLLDVVRHKIPDPCYVQPSLEPRTVEGLADVRIYALGPPTNPTYLGRDDPSKVPGQSEVYLAAGIPFNEDSALFAAACALPKDASTEDVEADRLRREQTCPFDRWAPYSREEARDHPRYGRFFRTRYLNASDSLAPAWRRIDDDWLDAATQLALDLDDHVNNTSLVLAFELGEGGPVLLFPGDAQVGNWLSWHELKVKDLNVTAQDLLHRTVLYKVGHHASHNATLKDKGLKMMTSTSRLVAMIPVDQAEARKPKGRNKNGWAMPYDKLLADLMVRTEGRVLRADQEPREPNDGEIEGWSKEKEKQERWQKFRGRVESEKATLAIKGETVTRTLYLQYTIHPEKT